MKRRTRAGRDARTELARRMREVADDPGTPALLAEVYRHELAELEAGPYTLPWWAVPDGFGAVGPHRGGTEHYLITDDGSLIPVEP